MKKNILLFSIVIFALQCAEKIPYPIRVSLTNFADQVTIGDLEKIILESSLSVWGGKQSGWDRFAYLPDHTLREIIGRGFDGCFVTRGSWAIQGKFLIADINQITLHKDDCAKTGKDLPELRIAKSSQFRLKIQSFECTIAARDEPYCDGQALVERGGKVEATIQLKEPLAGKRESKVWLQNWHKAMYDISRHQPMVK